MKALGGKIGNSICEDDKLDLALDILAKAKEKGVNLVLSIQTLAGNKFGEDSDVKIVDPMNIPDGWEGMDIGPATGELFAKVINGSKTILWNGPVGVFEFEKFTGGSRAVANAIVEATEKGAFSLIGGGDSVACINKFGLADKVSYVSTGGGALLEAIEGKELPGIAAKQDNLLNELQRTGENTSEEVSPEGAKEGNKPGSTSVRYDIDLGSNGKKITVDVAAADTSQEFGSVFDTQITDRTDEGMTKLAAKIFNNVDFPTPFRPISPIIFGSSI